MKLYFSLILTLLLQVQALAGHEIANGGDAISAEFISKGQFLKDNWQKIILPANFPVDESKFGQLVKTVIIETRDSVDLDGRIVDAINIPSQNRIVVNRSRWPGLSANERMTLVFHEYLGLVTDADRNFEITPKALQEIVPYVDLIDRMNGIFFTNGTLKSSEGCPNLNGQWKTCEIQDADLGKLPMTNFSVSQIATGQVTTLAISSKIVGINDTLNSVNLYDGSNLQLSCNGGSVLNAQYSSSKGTALSYAEFAKLGEELYISFAMPGLSTTIICK